jgi:ferredoxin
MSHEGARVFDVGQHRANKTKGTHMSGHAPTPARRLIRVVVDRDLCVGAGICAGTHPDLFRLKPEGHSEYFSERLDDAAAQEAAELCPVSAISLIYED